MRSGDQQHIAEVVRSNLHDTGRAASSAGQARSVATNAQKSAQSNPGGSADMHYAQQVC